MESVDLHRYGDPTEFQAQGPTPADHRQRAEENQEQDNCDRNKDRLRANHSFVFYVPFHFQLQIGAVKKLVFSRTEFVLRLLLTQTRCRKS
jgi:hypothetical protein